MSDDEPIQLRSRADITRRDLLELFAAGVAVMKTGCIQRTGEEIRPQVQTPEVAPGIPQFYATAMTVDGYATGLLVETHAGRPTKLEGNPAHPSSLGATTAQHQAAILDLYDPHRLRAPTRARQPASWDRFARELGALPQGELWLVMAPDASPAVAHQIELLRQRYPQLRIVRDEVFGVEHERATELAFGERVDLQLALERAEVVVALDADLAGTMPNSTRWSRDLARRRAALEGSERFARLYVAEPMPTSTGSIADDRLAVRAGDIAAVAIALAAALDARGVASVRVPPELLAAANARIPDSRWIVRVAERLAAAPRASAIVAGPRQPAAVQALVHRLSLALGNIGTTTQFTPAIVQAGDATLADVVRSIDAGRAGAVIVIDCDPVRSMPELALDRVPFSACAATHANATSTASLWTLPVSHFLEAWGDARAYDGTASIVQPAIRPLHDSRSRLQLLAMFAGVRADDDRALVRDLWEPRLGPGGWRAALSSGVIPGTESKPLAVRAGDTGRILDELAAAFAIEQRGYEVDLAPSPALGDGRFANNPWLQELPHPITKQTWGNAACMSEATALALGVRDGDAVGLARGAMRIELPAIIVPGHAERCITVELGYGGHAALAAGGANGQRLGRGPIVHGVAAAATGRTIELARTQDHFDRHDRETAFAMSLAEFRAKPHALEHHRGELPTLLDKHAQPPEILQWAMTIDTTICTGCSSCVIACQAENNIPVVGPDDVHRGREMQWLRIDTYFERGQIVHQPMMCQHCENAPCEYVCPTFATAHSPDGLNEMSYNRCIGTRFCSNNCPYKVRRFNWFGYDRREDGIAELQRNPDVTVRARGVMEKCTYCVQRIRGAEHRARMEKRAIAPGEVVTACQQACPTGAIQFGALQHDSPMTRGRRSQRVYATLHELGTRPRTMYLAAVRDTSGEER